MNRYIDIHAHHQGSDTVENIFPSNAKSAFEQRPLQLFSLGLHPWHIKADFEEELRLIEIYSTQKQVVAIGETGLDKLCKTPLAIQREVFQRQIHISQACKKPLVIHCVKMVDDLLEIKKRSKNTQAWILHGFRGNAKQVQQLLSHGFYISFGLQYSKETLMKTPLERLFLETDETAIPIENHYEKVVEILNIDEQALCCQISDNFDGVFGKILF